MMEMAGATKTAEAPALLFLGEALGGQLSPPLLFPTLLGKMYGIKDGWSIFTGSGA